jgi:hypothetical protein
VGVVILNIILQSVVVLRSVMPGLIFVSVLLHSDPRLRVILLSVILLSLAMIDYCHSGECCLSLCCFSECLSAECYSV